MPIRLIESLRLIETFCHALKPVLITVALTAMTAIELYRWVVGALGAK